VQLLVTRRPFRKRPQRGAWLLGAAPLLVFSSISVPAGAAPKRGDALQTDSLSMLLASRDYTTHTTTTIRNALNLSENVGLHYYFVDRLRVGMNLQLTERLWPHPPPGSSRLQRVAFMPQLGWSFYDPFYTAVIFSYAPRTQGRALPDLAVLGALGMALPVTRRVKLSLAAEVPFAFLQHRTLGVVGVMGVSIRL
jgi:hypothetical protein